MAKTLEGGQEEQDEYLADLEAWEASKLEENTQKFKAKQAKGGSTGGSTSLNAGTLGRLSV